MKKHDEGYALVLVVVVMIVMSLVAASVLTFSLRNLQNQQKSIQRMEDKYAAQGMIEEYLNSTTFQNKSGTDDNASSLSVLLSKTDGDSNSITATITAKSGTTTINCTVKITSTSEINSEDSSYTVESPTVTYTSYEITYTDASNSEGGDGQ